MGYRSAASAVYRYCRYCASVRNACNVYSIHPTNEKTIMENIKPQNKTTIPNCDPLECDDCNDFFYPFFIGVVILNTNVDGDHRSDALSPDNIQVIGTSSGNIVIIYYVHRIF